MPEAYGALAERLAPEELQRRLDDLADRIAVNAADMTPHAEFIASYCAAAGVTLPGVAASAA